MVSAPHVENGSHIDRRFVCEPGLLGRITRLEKVLDFVAVVEPVRHADLSQLYAQKRVFVTRVARLCATKTAPAHCHYATTLQVDLRDLITGLAHWRFSTVRGRSNRHQGSRPPVPLGSSTPPTLLGTIAKPGFGAMFDKTWEVFGELTTTHMPMVSSPGTVFGKGRSAVPNEEEYAGMITDGTGGSIKLAVRTLVACFRDTRKAHSEFALAAHLIFNRKNAAVEGAKKLPTVQKSAKVAEGDSAVHAGLAAMSAADPIRKGKGKDGDDPA